MSVLKNINELIEEQSVYGGKTPPGVKRNPYLPSVGKMEEFDKLKQGIIRKIDTRDYGKYGNNYEELIEVLENAYKLYRFKNQYEGSRMMDIEKRKKTKSEEQKHYYAYMEIRKHLEKEIKANKNDRQRNESLLTIIENLLIVFGTKNY